MLLSTSWPVMHEIMCLLLQVIQNYFRTTLLSNATVNVLNVKLQVKSFILDRIIGDANELSLRWIIYNKWKLRLFGCGFGQTCFRCRFRSSGAITRSEDGRISLLLCKWKKKENCEHRFLRMYQDHKNQVDLDNYINAPPHRTNQSSVCTFY